MNKKKREIWEVEVDLKKLWHNFLDTRSEDGFGFLRPGLKTGVESDIFWSEIGSGFGKPGGTPQPRIPRNTPPGLKFPLLAFLLLNRNMFTFWCEWGYSLERLLG